MYVAGIDAHTRYCVVVVVNRMGERVLSPTKVPTRETERLRELLAPYRPLDVVVETSPSWPWLHGLLQGDERRFVLAHARRLRAIAESTYKRDAVDAELLARMQLAGLIPAVYATPPEQREWAALLRHREVLVRHRTALVNRIHAQLHLQGLELARGRLLTRAGREWVRTTARPKLTTEQWWLVRSHLHVMAHLRPIIRSLDQRIEAVAATIPAAQLLQTIPGIGPQRALVLCAEAHPISRFRTPAHLTSYAGLAPRTSQSGERGIRHGSIPAGANRWLRGTLVRAVVSHTQTAPTTWLTEYYVRQKARVGWRVARIATARKLARAIHAMLRTNTCWSNTPPRGELQEAHAASTA
jgi:transposase